MSQPVSGTEGYAEEAGELFTRYENIRSADAHRAVLHLMPSSPRRVLDIGAGTGRDAAWFADMGHHVVAVEPTDALRLGAIARHPSPAIEWLNDSLPDLALLRRRNATFDLVMLTAVWMHLDIEQRRRAMPNLASRVADDGMVIMTLRHGPVPPGRRMFEVSPDETTELVRPYGLQLMLNVHSESIQAANRPAGVSWSTIALVKANST
ncbi:class I SAM-dependent methyltransferase [Bradyrhizobium sp. CCGUVB1N3]|uniref:class I SAM-dependent methyltransferase n=1 Tax=Bradyrhizobium sp. CCGUVB1N3 TaxID=2949629 RepID=UPI0020B384EA|nr:class I SAM-dependent methyltransferase [Bradyrhizobium sp. CCGUVB1N3]MCP3477280.1 class I SAM-dependent methyltransferase [Bradyrhizobium sp. CCGUVB1N3]